MRAATQTRLAPQVASLTAPLERALIGTVDRLGTLGEAASLLAPALDAAPSLLGDVFASLGETPARLLERAPLPLSPTAAVATTVLAGVESLAPQLRAVLDSRVEAASDVGSTALAASSVVTPESALAAHATRRSRPTRSIALAPRSLLGAAKRLATHTPQRGLAHAGALTAGTAAPAGTAPTAGFGAGSSASGLAGGIGLSLALVALSLSLAPLALRRLRLAAARWRTAPLRLIPARPG